MDALWEAPALEQARQNRTEFPPELRANNVRTLIYRAYSHELGGTTITRWAIIISAAVALLWATGFFPGRWPVVVLGAGTALLLGIAVALLRRQDFIRFFEPTQPASHDDVTPRAQPVEVKFPVYITGRLDVEGRTGRFTALPGFYRTFATREHALLCRLVDTRFLGLASQPADRLGMWYAFFLPDQIARVRTGKLQFDRALRPAIAVDYTIEIPAEGRFKRDKEITETLYITPMEEADFRPILADLLADLPVVTADIAPVTQPRSST